jgi:hypothetical protein
VHRQSALENHRASEALLPPYKFGGQIPDKHLSFSLDIAYKLLIYWLPGTDYSAFGRTLRVALAGDRRRCEASSNRLVYIGGSN